MFLLFFYLEKRVPLQRFETQNSSIDSLACSHAACLLHRKEAGAYCHTLG